MREKKDTTQRNSKETRKTIELYPTTNQIFESERNNHQCLSLPTPLPLQRSLALDFRSLFATRRHLAPCSTRQTVALRKRKTGNDCFSILHVSYKYCMCTSMCISYQSNQSISPVRSLGSTPDNILEFKSTLAGRHKDPMSNTFWCGYMYKCLTHQTTFSCI